MIVGDFDSLEESVREFYTERVIDLVQLECATNIGRGCLSFIAMIKILRTSIKP